MNFFLQLTINGILLGSFYATMSLGFSTIWGVMRLINLAHGEFLLMGGFVAWFFFNPEREQNLTIGGSSQEVAIPAFLIITVIGAYLLIKHMVDKQSIPHLWQRWVIGLGVAGPLATIVFALWDYSGFADINISLMFLVMIGLFFSIGFIISHIVLQNINQIPSLRQRRIIGYGSSLIIVLSGHWLWWQSGFTSIDPFLSLPFIFVLFFSMGYSLQKGLLNRIVEGPYLTMLLITFSISIILQNFGLQIFAADPRKINIDYGTAIKIGDTLTVSPTKLLTLIVSVGMIAGLVIFLKKTRTGYAIRAAAQNKMAARLMGINIYETYAITFGISIALTGIAGALMGTFQPITPVNGPPWTLRAFAIVALGGLGKVQGVIAGGLVLGLAESYVGGYVDVGWAIAMAFIILVITLVVRPQGITGGMVVVEE